MLNTSIAKNKDPQLNHLFQVDQDKSFYLNQYLADLYAIYLKTQNYHWNVKGTDFYSFHKLFEEQYTKLAKDIDIVAEHITSKGHVAKGSFEAFSRLTDISSGFPLLSSHEMVRDLMLSHKNVMERLKEFIEDAEENKNLTTADLYINQLKTHEKMAWMLEATTKQNK